MGNRPGKCESIEPKVTEPSRKKTVKDLLLKNVSIKKDFSLLPTSPKSKLRLLDRLGLKFLNR